MAGVITPIRPQHRYQNAAEWLDSLGGVPLERIVFDPLPGTATEADLLQRVERGDSLCELIDGTLVEKPVGLAEAIISANLIIYLGYFVLSHDLGAVSGPDSTLRMAFSGRIRLPDVSFIAKGRLPETRQAVPTLAPDLAVEVLSDSNTAREIAQKLAEYFQSGTRLACVIDPPTRTVAIYHEPGEPTRVIAYDGTLSGETVVPGFEVPVAHLFCNVPGYA